jgi:hypothetical protein
MPTLDRPRESTVRRLYALSMNRCAFPDCTIQLVTATMGTIVGEVCHIRAYKPGGPRYVREQTDDERHGFDNLILMCGNHHKEIDTAANLDVYTDAWLIELKRTHENQARETGEITTSPEVIKFLTWTVTVYEAGATHMDFRNAVFKVGGEGGTQVGRGGQGGVVNIFGIASLPRDIAQELTVDLAGGSGEFPASGGGGGGVLTFLGRPATADDVACGLKVPLFFPANGCQVSDGLLFVLGAGWEHFWINKFPHRSQIAIAFTVEFGSIDPNVLIRFDIGLKEPSGNEIELGATDVGVPEPKGAINRTSQTAVFSFGLESTGIYELTIASGGARLARYRFEARLR